MSEYKCLRRSKDDTRRQPIISTGIILIISIVLLFLSTVGCASTQKEGGIKPTTVTAASSIQDIWGIQIIGLRLTAAGYMLDFRYRIVDPNKALPIVDRRNKPYLIDQASGSRFMVPNPPKLGPLRQTTKYGKPKEGRTYFILFANPGRFINQGSEATVVIGDFRVENLTVE